MAKTLSTKNVKDWKTTLLGIIGGGIVLATILWPDKVNAETGDVIKTAATEIVIGIGALIPVIVAIFGKD